MENEKWTTYEKLSFIPVIVIFLIGLYASIINRGVNTNFPFTPKSILAIFITSLASGLYVIGIPLIFALLRKQQAHYPIKDNSIQIKKEDIGAFLFAVFVASILLIIRLKGLGVL